MLVMWRFIWKSTPPNSSWLRLKVKTSQLAPVFVWVNSGILIWDSFNKAKKVPSFQVRIKSFRSMLCVGSTSCTRSHQKCVYRNVYKLDHVVTSNQTRLEHLSTCRGSLLNCSWIYLAKGQQYWSTECDLCKNSHHNWKLRVFAEAPLAEAFPI